MTNIVTLHLPQSSLRVIGLLQRKTLALFIATFLLFNACAPNNGRTSSGDIAKAVATTVVATLVGAAAEAGVLALTSSNILATVAGMVAGGLTSYMLDSFSIRCNDCGTTTTYRQLTATEGDPLSVECSNPQCSRHEHGDAYMVVFGSQERMNAMLRQSVQKLPPTCLLSKEDLGTEGVKLTWHSENATTASLNGESVNLNGSRLVKPTEATTYILKVIGRYGKDQDSVSVEGQADTTTVADLAQVTNSVSSDPSPPPVMAHDASIFVPAGQTIYGVLEESLQTGEAFPGQEFHLNIRQPVYVGDTVAIPSGSRIIGRVMESAESGRVEGRARLRLAFENLEIGSRSYNISAMRFTREAASTVKKDAAKVGVGAAIGAGIGAIIGGKKGAAKGAAAGGAAGAGVVLATKGDEVRLQSGERIQVRLIEPVKISVEQ